MHPLLRSSWRYSFEPSTTAGSLVQVPLQIDLFYAPTSSVTGAVSTGIGTSLSLLSVPINVRLTAGIGGGAIEGAPDPGGARPSLPVLGPAVGAAVGYERAWFRMEVRWDQLINVLPGPGSIPMGSLHVGAAF